jgi:hypothetical protein
VEDFTHHRSRPSNNEWGATILESSTRPCLRSVSRPGGTPLKLCKAYGFQASIPPVQKQQSC